MKYEYKVIITGNLCDGELNEYGNLGWKLVSVVPSLSSFGAVRVVFMREKVERTFLKG